MQTTARGYKKPIKADGDFADLEVFVGDNMDLLESNLDDLQSQITTNETDIETKLQTHKDSDTSHLASKITNDSNVGGSKVKDALENIDNRIDNIIAQSGTSSTEVVDARLSAISGTTYLSLKDRLDNETKYRWIEEKTITSGNNSFTLTNQVSAGHKLQIKDKKYGVDWFETTHWTRSGQVITLTETALDEDLTFQIINFG